MMTTPAARLPATSAHPARERTPPHAAPHPAPHPAPLPRRHREILVRFLLSWPFPLAVLLLWQLAAQFEWLPPQILPPPAMVALTLADLIRSGELPDNLWISLWRVLAGFAAGGGAGLALGILMGLSPRARDYLYPSFRMVAQVPSIGWLPLLMMLVGIGEALKIILIAKAAFVPLALNTYKGLENVPTRFIDVARVYRFTRWQLLTKVVFPAALPQIWNGIRHSLTHAWLALVAVELLASSEGLGFMIVYGRQLYQLDVVLAAVVVVGAVGYVLDRLLALVELRLLRWRRNGF
jgi:sulfonate transport system permease protein